MDEWFKDWFDADYAALYAHRDEAEAARAVATLLRVAPTLALGPVLDLACGGGRHLAELRRTNPLAMGLDLSPHLLALAPRELHGWLIRGDMRHLPFRNQTLSGVCMWFTPFGYFNDDENRRLLCRIQGLLRPEGILVLDLMNPRRLRQNLVEEDELERDGIRVHNRRSLEDGRIVKRMRIEKLDSGATREAVESVRVYEPEEIGRMADGCGLKVARELGGYDGGDYDPDQSERWIGLLVKKSMDDRPPTMRQNAYIPGGE